MSDYIIHHGVELHKKFFNFCSYDERAGESMEGRVYTNDQVNKYLAMFDVSAPQQTKAIAWASDRVDARMLLHLLMAVPPVGYRRSRSEMLGRYSGTVVRIRAQLMNMVHSYLSKQNLIDSVTEVVEVYEAYGDHPLCGLYQSANHSIGDRTHV